MRYSQGELEHARTALTRALALAHDTGDMAMVAQAENLLGHVELAAGNVDAAREHCSPAALNGSGRWRSRGASGIR